MLQKHQPANHRTIMRYEVNPWRSPNQKLIKAKAVMNRKDQIMMSESKNVDGDTTVNAGVLNKLKIV